MKCLILGGRGFIGSHLIPALKKKGHTVRSYDLKDQKDILNTKQLSKAITWADVIYHLAALTNVQESCSKPLEYYDTNVVGTENVVRASLNKKLIYTSTAATYDPLSSPYATSKKYAEECIICLHEQYVILRLFNVYGQGMNNTTMLARFQKENPIIIYGDGLQTRDFIHIDDVVQILVDALKPKWNGFVGDVGTGRSRTVLSIARQYKKPIKQYASRKEVRHSVADIGQLSKLYNKSFKKLNSWIDKHR